MARIPLPIDEILPELRAALAPGGAAVLTAPPGSGKSTRAAPALLDVVGEEEAVLLLQPRRVAARLVARRIASERGVRPGEEVGYRVRFEAKVSEATRLEVLTEGLLTRRLQDDPFLEGGTGGGSGWGRRVGAVVLDELHERSLQTDLALSMLREVCEVRDDLRILAMSATLDAAPVAAFLGGEGPAAPVLHAEGRTYPVALEYLGPDLQPGDRDLPGRVAAAVRRALAATEAAQDGSGHLLVFLPGAREIGACQGALSDLRAQGVAVLPLHGRLPAREQDAALAPGAPAGCRRKVVLATNIAETSVTLPGVVAVVDSGLARQPRLDPTTGLERLHTVPISRASADQRAGRAGRTGPGRCLRLWTEVQHARRPAAEAPEIARLELTSLVLSCRAWAGDARERPWLTPPPEAALARAEALLAELGALDDDGLSEIGRRLETLPVHPRVGRVLLAAGTHGHPAVAAALAALVTERDPFPDDIPLPSRLAAVLGRGRQGADPRGLDRVRRVARQLASVARAPKPPARIDWAAVDALLPALLAGFPERLGRRRDETGRAVLLASGSGAELAPWRPPPDGEWLVAITLRARDRGAPWIDMLVDVPDALLAALPRRTRHSCAWDPDRQAVVAADEEHIGALVLRRIEVSPDPAEAAAALADAASAEPARLLDVSRAVEQLVGRVSFLAEHPDLAPDGLPDWPDIDTALRDVLPDLCVGRRKLSELRGADVHGALLSRLPWDARQALDRLCPPRWTLPTGQGARLDYRTEARQGNGPVLRAKAQQLYGCTDGPRVLGGRVPVTLHLLAPNDRPLQVTTDLASFWAGAWSEVRKDMRGRYVKWEWPEDPAQAPPHDHPGHLRKLRRG